MKPKLETLIYDVDGTLANTENQGHLIAFNRDFKETDGLTGNDEFPFVRSCCPLQEGKRRMECYLDEYLPSFEHQGDFQVFIAHMRKSKSRHYTDLPAEGAVPLRSVIKRLISDARKQGLHLDPTKTLHQQAVSKIRSTILQ